MSAEKCADCGSLWGHSSPAHAAACARDAQERAHLTEYVTSLDRPPSAVAVLDLWAHMRSRVGADVALGATQLVLDLGWRPTVGTEVDR